MSMIETEHRGKKIRYAENADQWVCWDLTLEADTLSKLKDKINRALSEASKHKSTPAIKFDGGSGGPATATPCLIVGDVIIEKERDYKVHGSENKYLEVPYVFIAWQENDGKKRKKVKLENLIRPTPEIDGVLAEMESLRLECVAINKRRDELASSLPRMRPEDVQVVKVDEDEE